MIPHVSVIAAGLCVTYATIIGIRTQQGDGSLSWAAARLVGFFVNLALILAYAALFGCLTFLNDLPTRSLVTSYLPDLPSLVNALPVSGFAKGGLALTVIAVAIGLSVFLSACLEPPPAVLFRLRKSRPARLCTLMAFAGSLSYLTVASAVPLEWHTSRYEPLFMSIHDVQLATNTQYGQKNLAEVARDKRIAQEYASKRAARRPNVILIYVDALRADVTQPYGSDRINMPFVSGLVTSGAISQVEFALSTCSATICGLGGLLQSRNTRQLDPDNFSLPKLLAQQGYRNAYVLSSNHQGYFDLKKYYEPYHFYVDGADLDRSRSTDDYIVMEGLERLGPFDGRPTFLMVGLVSPHPIAIKHDENRIFKPDRLFSGLGFKPIEYINNYHNGIRQADRVIGMVWGWLAKAGYLNDDAIVVITGDHGESLGEGGLFGHSKSLQNSELRVPLWTRIPSVDLSVRRLARHVDLAPTIVEAMGMTVPESWVGTSLLTSPSSEWSYHYLPDKPCEVAVVRYQRDRALKYVASVNRGTFYVSDLFSDPQETKDVSSTLSQDELAAFRAQADQRMRGLSACQRRRSISG